MQDIPEILTQQPGAVLRLLLFFPWLQAGSRLLPVFSDFDNSLPRGYYLFHSTVAGRFFRPQLRRMTADSGPSVPRGLAPGCFR